MTRNSWKIFSAISLFTGLCGVSEIGRAAAFQFGGLRLDAGAITSAAGTTALTKASKQLQIVSGSTTQTVQLPDATTLQSGYWFDISNKSTSGIFVNNNGAIQLTNLEPNQNSFFYLTSTSTNGGVWDVQKAQASRANQDWKDACNEATTAALPANTYANGLNGIGASITGVSLGALTVDSVTPSVGDRVLVKNETASHNGIYTVTSVGSVVALFVLTRTSDYDNPTEITAGTATYILSGTVNTGTSWALTTTGTITVGTSSLNFSQIAGPGAFTAGTGITITGTSIALTTPVTVPNGGTGLSTVTNHGVVIGQATSALAATSAGTSGQVLTSNGASADPTFQTASSGSCALSTLMKTGSYTVLTGDFNCNKQLLLECNGSALTTISLLAASNSGYSLKVTNTSTIAECDVKTTGSDTLGNSQETTLQLFPGGTPASGAEFDSTGGTIWDIF